MLDLYTKHRILFISVSPKLKGGVAAVTKQYLSYFKHSSLVATKISENWIDIFLYPYFLLKILFTILIKKNTIVHIHGASRGSFYRKYVAFILIKYLLQKKVIYHIHGAEYHVFYSSSNKVIRGMIKDFINNTDVIICLSDSWKKFFCKNFTPRQIEVIPNAVSKIEEKPIILEEREKVKFLFLGRVGKRKGIIELLEASNLLKSSYGDMFEVWICGDGNISLFEKQIQDYHLESQIKYLGWVEGERKVQLLKDADVFVLPSYNEGLPVSMLEAMAYGMPVISTKVGGIPEVVKDKESGFLVEPGDVEALRASMEKFINNHALIEQMGICSCSIIEENYTTEVVFQKLESIYTTLRSSY